MVRGEEKPFLNGPGDPGQDPGQSGHSQGVAATWTLYPSTPRGSDESSSLQPKHGCDLIVDSLFAARGCHLNRVTVLTP